MRSVQRFVCVLLVVSVCSIQLAFASPNDWRRVERLRPGTRLWVLLQNGENVEGWFQAATDVALTIEARVPTSPARTQLRDIQRQEIRRVIQLRSASDLPHPDPRKCEFIGAGVGALAGAAVGATSVPKGARLGGGILGAGMGALMGMPVGDIVCGVRVIGVGLSTRRERVIYEAPPVP